MVWKSFVNGIRQMLSYKRVLLIFYLVNLAAGLIVTMPMWSLLGRFAGHSFSGAELARRVDFDFISEFLKHSADGLAADLALLLIVAVLYWIVQLFLSGGALAVYHSGQPYRPELFWSGAGRYFLRFIRLALWAFPVFLIVFVLHYLEKGLERLIFGADPYEYVWYWGGWVRIGLRYLGFVLYLMVLDYARIYAVLTDERRMRVAVWRGVRFVAGNFWATLGLALLLFAAGWIGWGVFRILAVQLSSPATGVILAMFVWQQLFMIFRMGLQLSRYSGEMILYKWRSGML